MMHHEEDEEEEIEQELADVTFGELQKARANGSHSVFRKTNIEKKASRANKNRPMEVSSKRPVPRFREVIQAPKKVTRDPRFESLCGNLDEDKFRQRYDFLYESELTSKKEKIRDQLKESKDVKVNKDLKNQISLIKQEVRSRLSKHIDTESRLLSEHKKKEREATATKGKKPFYLKKSEVRKQTLVGKYNKLKETGKLDSFIEKKRRKNAAKDHRFMPYRRSDDIGQSSQ